MLSATYSGDRKGDTATMETYDETVWMHKPRASELIVTEQHSAACGWSLFIYSLVDEVDAEEM